MDKNLENRWSDFSTRHFVKACITVLPLHNCFFGGSRNWKATVFSQFILKILSIAIKYISVYPRVNLKGHFDKTPNAIREMKVFFFVVVHGEVYKMKIESSFAKDSRLQLSPFTSQFVVEISELP